MGLLVALPFSVLLALSTKGVRGLLAPENVLTSLAKYKHTYSKSRFKKGNEKRMKNEI